jgi:predicted kinase
MNFDINDESFFKEHKLLLCRGLPGASKSTLAALIAQRYNFMHFEADMYFIKDGVYSFDATEIPLAHKWCRESTEKAIKEGKSVAVSNTFTQLWELKSYTDIANHNKVPFKVIKCCGQFKNVHNVPVESLDKMAARWQDFKEELEYHPSY